MEWHPNFETSAHAVKQWLDLMEMLSAIGLAGAHAVRMYLQVKKDHHTMFRGKTILSCLTLWILLTPCWTPPRIPERYENVLKFS